MTRSRRVFCNMHDSRPEPTYYTRALLDCQAEMLFDGSNTLLQPFHTFLNLAIGEVNERACFSELLFKKGSIFGMTPVNVQLKSFGNKLKFMVESFRQNARMPFRVRGLPSKGVGRCNDELLDLRE